MKEKRFVDAVLERIFNRGFSCLNLPLLTVYARTEQQQFGAAADLDAFVEMCIGLPGVAHRPEMLGKNPSLTKGACEHWLAIHEAGHAIVGIKAGFLIFGVRFYGHDGLPGETGFEEIEWRASNDEDLLRRFIRVDVAANIAQLLCPVCMPPEGGRLSELYNDLSPGKRPSDFVGADAVAGRLTVVLGHWNGKKPIPKENWAARRAILAQAESEAEQVLRANMELLNRLAEQLLLGPMSGPAVLAIVNG